MIVVSVDRTEANVVKYDQPQIENLVKQRIGSAAVKSYITGQPSIDRSLKSASINELRRHELIAVGIVFLLLLIGLRAPLAALIVTVKAAASMLAAFGEVALLGHFMRLDAVGVAAGSMTGLAIGVGFGLLILDRFHRERLADGGTPRDEATAAMLGLESTGKAVLIGGTGLVVALGLVAIVGPTELMISVGAAALASAAFATGGAVVVMPAALVLFGRRIDMLQLPGPPCPRQDVVATCRRWQLGYAPCDLRRRCSDRGARRDRRSGARAERRTAVGQAAPDELAGTDRLPGGLAGDGSGLGDAVQPDRRREQRRDHDSRDAREHHDSAESDRQDRHG